MKSIVAIFILLCLFSAAKQSESNAQQLEHFRVEKVTDYLYAFISDGPWDPTLDLVDGNSYAIIGDDGVFVVDAHHLPVIAEANIAEIRKLTNKPIKYLLNTHWHGDHNTSNWVYQKAYPEIQIIAQTATREILSRRMPKWIDDAKNGKWDEYIKEYQKYIDDNKDEEGRPLTAERKDRIERVLKLLRKYNADSRRSTPVLPNVTFEHNLTLYLGGREVQVRHEHRANTPGDAYVWLPQDSILITGDILVHPIPYCFGSFLDEWVMQLDTMLALRPKLILPGHGGVQRDTAYLRTVRDMLADVDSRVRAAYSQGITTADSVRAAIDLSDWKKRLAGDDFNRQLVFEGFMAEPAVRRMLLILKNELGDDRKGN